MSDERTRSGRDADARLARLGALLDERQEPVARDDLALRRARARLLGRAAPPPPARRWLRLALVAALAGVSGAGATLLLLRPEPPPFVVGAASRGEALGAFLAAPAAGELPIRFPDGSRVALQAGAQGRVVEASGRRCRVLLERGAVAVEVTPDRGRRFEIDAGPYRVSVTGTRFSVRWDPQARAFAAALASGRILVSGPGIDGERALAPGERLEVRGGAVEAPSPAGAAELAERRDPVAGSVEAATPPSAAAATPLPALPPAAAAGRTGDGAAPSTAAASSARWRRLARAGDSRGAFEAAQAAGLGALLLAEAARLSGAIDRAEEAYRAVLARFPDEEDAQVARFGLARIAMDARGAPQAAIFELRRYLAEAPEGAFAREAAGRLVEALVALGLRSEARADARAYLARYPDGPHAAIAKGAAEE
jgi:ferric-dicitrate binding protein FerR (iron transport regulator)